MLFSCLSYARALYSRKCAVVCSACRMSTGEYWNGLMHDLMDQGHTFAFVYFASFTVLAEFIMLNLVVAVLLINYEEQQQNGNEPAEPAGYPDAGKTGPHNSPLMAVDDATPVSSSFRKLDDIASPRDECDDTQKPTILEELPEVSESSATVTLRPASPASPATPSEQVNDEAPSSHRDETPVSTVDLLPRDQP